MTELPGLIDWLRATIEGDKATASRWIDRRCDGCGKPVAGRGAHGLIYCTSCHPEDLPVANDDTIARCEAELALIEHNAQLHQLADPAQHPRQEYVLAAGASDHALKLLAYGYRHREGYHEEWKPEA